jgi:hypothetical protein
MVKIDLESFQFFRVFSHHPSVVVTHWSCYSSILPLHLCHVVVFVVFIEYRVDHVYLP